MLVKIVSTLYILKQKKWDILNEKIVKITTRSYAFKGCASSSNIETLNF